MPVPVPVPVRNNAEDFRQFSDWDAHANLLGHRAVPLLVPPQWSIWRAGASDGITSGRGTNKETPGPGLGDGVDGRPRAEMGIYL